MDFAGRETVQELGPIQPEGVVEGTNSRIFAQSRRLRTDIVATLGSGERRALAHRVEKTNLLHEMGAVMPLPLHILQLLLGHAEIMTEFMYESLPNLMTNFCLIGTDRLNVFLIQDDVGRTD